jgi:hypothetical protein
VLDELAGKKVTIKVKFDLAPVKTISKPIEVQLPAK